MWISPEEARSDFVLAAAAAVLGSFAVRLLEDLPFYPAFGSLPETVLFIAWVFVLTALVPILLVRYRGRGIEGYGLGAQRGGLGAGIAVALPIVALGYLRGLPDDGVGFAALGRFAGVLRSAPTVGQEAGRSGVDIALLIVFVAVVAVAGAVFYGFLTAHARSAFRSVDMTIVEGLRTFGVGAVAASAVLGLLNVVAGAQGLLSVGLHLLALLAMILLADRLVGPRETTTRATLLAPAIVALVAQILAFGGPLRGELLFGLFFGSMSAGVVLVVAALVETRRYAWAIVPVAVATALYPTCLSLPMALNASLSTTC